MVRSHFSGSSPARLGVLLTALAGCAPSTPSTAGLASTAAAGGASTGLGGSGTGGSVAAGGATGSGGAGGAGGAAGAGGFGGEAAGGHGPEIPGLVWPLSGTDRPDFPLSSTFGPRQRKSMNNVYEFHRGIDLPTPLGTPVYAVADGFVTRSGDDPGYQDLVVQLRHAKDGTDGSDCAGGCFYSNSIHLSSCDVPVGALVKRGDVIGHSGAGESGFEHLHFEIRDDGSERRNCVHPLEFLPYENATEPKVQFDAVDTSASGFPKVTVTTKMPAIEPDLRRVAVTVSDASTSPPTKVSSAVYDLDDWNYTYSIGADPDAQVNDPNWGGITVSPAPFTDASSDYVMTFTFTMLQGPIDAKNLAVTATAVDVRGRQREATYP